MFTPDTLDAMVADRGERLRHEADLARFARDRARFARSTQRRNRRRVLQRLLDGLRTGTRRPDHLGPVSSHTS